VHGTKKSGYIATFVEGRSGYLTAQLLTLDNGTEMKEPERIESTTGMMVYYANLYHSSERGTNENTNELLRYFILKKSSFTNITQEQLDVAVKLINTRPRKRLNWRTPE
jgi:IS30 family transposase